jgi:hypothetical protein
MQCSTLKEGRGTRVRLWSRNTYRFIIVIYGMIRQFCEFYGLATDYISWTRHYTSIGRNRINQITGCGGGGRGLDRDSTSRMEG